MVGFVDLCGRAGAGFARTRCRAFVGWLRDPLRRSGGGLCDFGVAGMPDGWVDRLAVAGMPKDRANAVLRLREAGAAAVVLVPPPGRTDGISRDLLPLVGSGGA